MRITLILNATINTRKVIKKRSKESKPMRQIRDTHSLSNRMHRQLRTSHINRPHPRRRANHRSDRAPAPAIVPDHEFLHRRQPRPPRELSHDQPRDAVRRVSLIGITLDDHASVHFGTVVLFVFGCVVGVDGVRLVDAQYETASDGAVVEDGTDAAGS